MKIDHFRFENKNYAIRLNTTFEIVDLLKSDTGLEFVSKNCSNPVFDDEIQIFILIEIQIWKNGSRKDL